jgi:phosphoinositide-3-kinase regulatory subunit 4
MKSDKASFWKLFKKGIAKVESPKESVVSVRKQSTSVMRKSEEYVTFLVFEAS